MLYLRVMSRYICIVVKENLPHCDITTNHTLNWKYSKLWKPRRAISDSRRPDRSRARHARRSGPTCPTIGPDMPDDRTRHARRPSPRRRVGCRGCRARRRVACRARRRVGCRARRRTGCRASMISHQWSYNGQSAKITSHSLKPRHEPDELATKLHGRG